MKAMIAATPLMNLIWRRGVGKVQIVFRPDTEKDEKKEFLETLAASILMELVKMEEGDTG